MLTRSAKGLGLPSSGEVVPLFRSLFFTWRLTDIRTTYMLPGLILAAAAAGLDATCLVGSHYERIGRYAFFAFDIAALSALLAFAPITSGGDVPQNLVFQTSRGEYYFVVVAISVLALSPALVLWTGLCAVVGLAGATAWIMAGMERIVVWKSAGRTVTRSFPFPLS